MYYPVVWLLGPAGLGVLLPIGDVLVVTYLDVVAKVGFGLIAANSLSTLQQLSAANAPPAADT